MKYRRRKSGKLLSTVSSLLISGAILSACSGGDDSTETAGIGGTGIGIGGTGIVSGEITGFGSVYVNGDRYDIDNSQFNVDGDVNATQTDLALGMVVQLNLEFVNGTSTSNALDVVYDDEIEGPISSVRLSGNQRIATIFGQDVIFDDTSTVFDANGFVDLLGDPLGFGSIGVPHVVEVSGFRVSLTEIAATYVRVVDDQVDPGNTEVELRGTISNYSPGLPETFDIDGVTITTDGNTEIEVPNSMLADGLYVEVEGVILTPTSVLANKIEFEDEDFDDDVDDISLQGIVSGFIDIDTDFFIDSQRVNASNAQPMGIALLDGMNIEIKGEIAGGILIAEKIENRGGETNLRSTIGTVDTINNLFEVTYPVAAGPTTIVIKTDAQTLFENETAVPPLTVPFSLDDLAASDFVRIKGQEVNGEVVASVVKRVDGAGQKLKLEGAVDTFVTNSSITILGITYDVDPTPGSGTDFSGFASSADFFAALNPAGGDIVEIEDDNIADGIADEVEKE